MNKKSIREKYMGFALEVDLANKIKKHIKENYSFRMSMANFIRLAVDEKMKNDIKP